MHDVERELKDLGERVGREVTHGAVPARRIARRARLRRAVAVSVPTVAAVLVAAVAYPGISRLTRDGGAERGTGDLAFATAATEEAGSARVELTVEMTVDGRAATTRATGELDFERVRSHLVTEEIGPTESGRVEMITIGDRVFQRRLGGPGGGSPKWIAADVPGGGAFGAGAGPADFLAELDSMADDVTRVGEEELGGVPVVRYRAVVDPDAGGSTLARLAERGDVEFDPMDVWVDELGRLRKLTFGSTVGDESTMRMTMTLSDFGIPVNVAAPDPEDVTDDLQALESESSDSGMTAGKSFSDFSTDTNLVFGEEHLWEPFVTVNIDDTGTALVCVQALSGMTRAVVVHEPTGDAVATFAPRRGRGTVGCAPPGIAHEDVDALLREPSEYTLRVEVERGPDVVVALAETGAPLAESPEK
ncbi:MAG: hypothetical protein M3279_04390 [Actinomycetota bacterium]|nr:hypothetical protein [Actinomycetota bacterium]